MINAAFSEPLTFRKTFPGYTGADGLASLSRGVTEAQNPDILEEHRLFSTDFEIKSLIESLQKDEENEINE